MSKWLRDDPQREPYAPAVPRVRHVWVAAPAKSFVRTVPEGEKGVSFSWSHWELINDDSGRYAPASSRQDGLGPAYPDKEDFLKVGDCVKGLIQFDSVKKAKIELGRYRNASGETAEWASRLGHDHGHPLSRGPLDGTDSQHLA